MPTYVYEVIRKDGSGGEQFEVDQKMSDAPLVKHPETDEPVRRIIAAFNAPHFRFDRAAKKIEKEDRANGALGG